MTPNNLQNEKSSFEILVCIGENKLESRILELCRLAGYSTNRSCYNFLSGTSADHLEDIPLVVTSDQTLSSLSKTDLENCLKSSNTQVLYIGSTLTQIPIASLWSITETSSDEEILHLVAKACVMHELKKENAHFRSVLSPGHNLLRFKSNSARMNEVLDLVDKIAAFPGSVLLTGESGTGKSLFARYIHSISSNKEGPFISLSCPTFPRDLMESELFGNEKGAFTGATGPRAGAVELANNGTLFLDEIGDLPIELQPKLLTFLQDKTTKRLGGGKEKKVSVRVISATNFSLEAMVSEKRFRSDLYYRINTFHIHLPPLRERKEDITLLANSILKRICEERNNIKPILSEECTKILLNHNWPGNIRELENVIEQATAYSKGSRILPDDLQKIISLNDLDSKTTKENLMPLSDTQELDGLTLKEIENLIISSRLKIFDNNKSKTANSLGISLKTLYNKLKDD